MKSLIKLLTILLLLIPSINYSQSSEVIQQAKELELKAKHLLEIAKLKESGATTLEKTVSTLEQVDKMVMKYGKSVKEIVTELASALKIPAEHVYKVLCKQALVSSVGILLTLLIGIIIISKSLTFLRTTDFSNRAGFLRRASYSPTFSLSKLLNSKKAKDEESKFTNDEAITLNLSAAYYIITLVLGMVLSIDSLCDVEVLLQGFINPEYAAIKTIFELVK